MRRMLVLSPENLAAARRDSGLSRESAAAQIGVSTSTLRNAESGRNTPAADVIARLAALYGVEWSDLFVHEPEATEPSTTRGEVAA